MAKLTELQGRNSHLPPSSDGLGAASRGGAAGKTSRKFKRARGGQKGHRKLLHELFGISISLGAISNMERRASEALAACYREALLEVRYAGVEHTDATSFVRRARGWYYQWPGTDRFATRGAKRGEPECATLPSGGSMGELRECFGGCHCGRVRYRVSLDLSAPVIGCNCSICLRTGTLLSFVPATQFKLEQGEDALTDYQFHRKQIHHLFCSTCGVRSFARGAMPDGTPMIAINTRCLEGVDPEQLTVQHFDGRSL